MPNATVTTEVETTAQTTSSDDAHSLRGTMVSVLTMALFFIACWGGVWMLYLYRR